MGTKEKIKLGCAVLCEGKYDKIKLSSVIDGTILTTDGFGVFNNSEKRALLRKLCESRGLVIITDSDKAGFFIRSKLKGMLPKDRVRHLYIPQIKGREKRKSHDSKEGLLGVEGIDNSTLFDIISRADLDKAFGTVKKICNPITKANLYELGLLGGKDSAYARAKLCEKLDLPKSLTSNALLSALEMLDIDFDSLKKAMEGGEYESFFPSGARNALSTLKENGFECFFVGGCVRDFMMGISAHDFDLTTNASSEQIISVLCKNGYDAFLIGGDCGTVGAKRGDEDLIEITPYRAESEYRDHRHPEKVVFVQKLEDDLSRRDFTVNSMALTADADGNIETVDLFDGMQDINRRIIKCVNDPATRFEEDALRILRAMRFSARLGFEIEENTAAALVEKRHLLSFISGERKYMEMKKILENPSCEGVLARFPEVFSEVVGNFSGNSVDKTVGGFCERLFYILRFNSANDIKSTLSRLKTSGDDKNRILGYKEIFELEKTCSKFEITAKYGYFYAEYLKAFGGYEKAEDIFENKDIPKNLQELCINGKDLLSMGFSGTAVGKLLSQLLTDALSGKVPNKKDELCAHALKITEETT